MICTAAKIVWIFMNHNRSSDDVIRSNQLNQIVLHVQLGEAVLVRPDVAKCADVPVLTPWRPMLLFKWVVVRSGILAPPAQFSLLMNVKTV